MKTTMKRFFSGMMALSLAFCGTSIVSAEDVTDLSAGGSLVLEPELSEPNILVTVPTADEDKIVLNPFNIGGTGQVYSASYEIINNSNIPVSVSFSAIVELTNVTLAQKAPAATGDKQAMINLSYTDGLGKTTTTVMKTAKSTEGDNANVVSVATAMAPLGGAVKFNFTGSTTVNPTKDGSDDPWTEEDTIKATVAYKFTPNVFATYNIVKTVALYSTDLNAITVDNGTELEAVIAKLPTRVLGDGKELPVTWKCTTTDGYKADTAGKYTFVPMVKDDPDEEYDDGIYTIADGIAEKSSIEVTVEAAANNG
ncbi:MAG: hypothetical protein J6A58_14625 [Oscillospiraceae bacterium]|nr:hypothetical protein [Oscillospiraceae bacterium]